MKILMMHPHDIYSPSEPWTTRIRNLAFQLAKKGHSVKLVYFPLNGERIAEKRIDSGFEVIPLSRKLGIAVLLRNCRELLRLGEWADIIHFQKCYYYVALPAMVASLFKNKPVHYDWDDWETKIFYYSNPKQYIVGEFINIFEKLIPKAADTVSVASEYLKKSCIRRGVSENNIFFAPVGADLSEFKPSQKLAGIIKKKYNIKGNLVLYIGQLHGGQYAELFIKAAGVVLKNAKNVTFMIVGDGYRALELKELAKKEGLDSHIIFTGSVAHDSIPAYLNSADICVACFEDNDITRCKSPLKVVEYLACGKAIVASNIAEVGRMLDGAGELVKPGDYLSLANGILKLLSDKVLRERLSKLARERAEKKYGWENTAASLLSAYNKSLGGRKNAYLKNKKII